jgi:hypothetical protein
MKNLFLALLTCFGINVSATAAPVVIDFSRSHTVDDLKKSGLVMKEIVGGAGEQVFSFQNQEILVRLPTGRSIEQKVKLGIIDTEHGVITQFSVTGDVMPHDQAILVGQSFHQSFGLPNEPLDRWNRGNADKIRDGTPYSISVNERFYPRVGFGIYPSMNGLYPWVVRLLLSWDWDLQKDWNEERAWRELPSTTYAVISLNPPSGLKYDRRDAHKISIAAAQAEQAKLRVLLLVVTILIATLWLRRKSS